MKKYFIASLLALPFILQAGISDRVEQLEKEMAEVGSINSMDNFGTSFTTAGTNGSNNLYIFLDPLYWHAKVGGTDYAYTVKVPGAIVPLNLPPKQGRVKDNTFGWDWGLRVGLGFYFRENNWDLNANYTWFQTHDTDTVRKNPPAYILATRLNEIIWMNQAKSTFDVGYNNVNLELGKSYFLSSKISVKPHIGVKSAWIDLDQDIHYYINFVVGQSPFDGTVFKVRGKSYQWGLGPRFGSNMEWYLGDGFSISGNIAGALLYSYNRGSIHLKPDGNSNNFGELISRKIKQKTHSYIPTVQMFLGLIWETFMFENTKHLTLGAGYEVEYYWRANNILHVEDAANVNIFRPHRDHVDCISEDVSFYGLTLKARLDF